MNYNIIKTNNDFYVQKNITITFELIVNKWIELFNEYKNHGRFFASSIYNKNTNQIIHSINEVKKNKNPIYHAEISVINKYYKENNSTLNLEYCILFSSHKPCLMCASAIYWTGIKEVYYLFDYNDTENIFDIKGDKELLNDLVEVDDIKSNSIKFIKVDNSMLRNKLINFYNENFDNNIIKNELDMYQ